MTIDIADGIALLAIGLLVLLAIFVCKLNINTVLRRLVRLRWLWLMMLLVYAFNTPGVYVSDWPFDWAPSYDGIIQGFLQISRISLIIISISILMMTTSSQALLAGIYQLILPCKRLGVDPDRFAARLLLTLEYIEKDQMLGQDKIIRNQLTQMLSLKNQSFYASDDVDASCAAVEMELKNISLGDALYCAGLCAIALCFVYLF